MVASASADRKDFMVHIEIERFEKGSLTFFSGLNLHKLLVSL